MTLLDIHNAVKDMEGLDWMKKEEVPLSRNKDTGTLYADIYTMEDVLRNRETLTIKFHRHGSVYESISLSINEEVIFTHVVRKFASDADVTMDLLNKIAKKIDDMYKYSIEEKEKYILESLSAFRLHVHKEEDS